MRGTSTQFVMAWLCVGGGLLTGCELVADVDNTLIPVGGAGGEAADGGSGGSGAAGAAGGGGTGAAGASGGEGFGGIPGGGSGGVGGCENGTLDGDETDVDCGGTECGKCNNGFVCEGLTDCKSKFCDADGSGGGPSESTCAACSSNDDCVDAAPAWKCSGGVCINGGAKPNGEACNIAGDCTSLNCVDGLCCNTACGGGATDDCVACSVAAGAFADGTCGPRASGTACGDASSSECDNADVCNGAGSCLDNFVANGTPCTDDMLFCTGVEACNGAGACVSPGDPCAAPLTCDESGGVCFQNVWVNELHYDNTGEDAGEAIEVAGVAGIDLTGWGVIFYDGATGTAYAGFGTVSMLTPGIQQDAPDGFALMDETFSVVQFLSTEGSFIATDGPAMGMTSVDIGVLEDDITAVGNSLQLTGGPGVAYQDFTWASPGASTFGAVNTGQSF